MLSIIKSAELVRLREQAAKTEDTVAGEVVARVELEKLSEQLRTALVGKAQAEAETARARAEVRATEERVKTDQAEVRRVAESVQARLAQVRRDAEQLAGERNGYKRTIGELRGELERAQALLPSAKGLPEHTVLQFRSLGGGLVVVTAAPTTIYSDRYGRSLEDPEEGHTHRWQCVTCGDDSSYYTSHDLDDMRRRANEHAGVCRAIPTETTVLAAQRGV